LPPPKDALTESLEKLREYIMNLPEKNKKHYSKIP